MGYRTKRIRQRNREDNRNPSATKKGPGRKYQQGHKKA